MIDSVDIAERLDAAAEHRAERRHVAEHNADSANDDEIAQRVSSYSQMMIDAVTGTMLRAALGVRK